VQRAGQQTKTAPQAPWGVAARMPPPGLTPPTPLCARQALQPRAHRPRLAPQLAAGALGEPRFVLSAAGVHLV
jgi:hypothetical protein